MLTLSSEHLTPATKAWLNTVRDIRPDDGKAALHSVRICTPDPGNLVPDDLRQVLKFARDRGYDDVMFVEPPFDWTSGLPVYYQGMADGGPMQITLTVAETELPNG